MEKDKKYLGWWCLDEKDKIENCESLPGELTISSDSRILLKIMGNPKQLQKNLQNLNEQSEYPVIIGFAKDSDTNKDHSFTLMNSRVSGYRSSSLTEIIISSTFALIDYQIESLKNFRIGYMRFHIKYLEEWIGISGHSRKKSDENDTRYKVVMEYLRPSPINLAKLNKLDIDIRFTASSPIIPLIKDVTISEEAFVVVIFKRRQKLEFIFDTFKKLENFFTFAIGEPVPVDKIELMLYNYHQAKRKKIKDNHVFQFVGSKNRNYTARTGIKEHNMLFPFKTIQENCPELISYWMTNYDKFGHALNLYFGKIYSKSQYEENAFLDIVISLEVLHRIQKQDFNNKNSKYLKKLESILNQHNKNEQLWLMKRLNKKDENTLLNRFEDIMETLKPISKIIFSSPQVSIEKIVSTRNFLVHSVISDQYKRKIIPSNMLYRYTNKLTVIFQALYIYYITNDIKLVMDRIDQSTINKIFIRYKSK